MHTVRDIVCTLWGTLHAMARHGGSPHYGVGASFVVVERVVVNSVPTAVEIMWEVEEGEAAIEERRQVFELLHHDACGRGGGRLLPTSKDSTARERSGCRENICPLPPTLLFSIYKIKVHKPAPGTNIWCLDSYSLLPPIPS